ncbi:MAG TPA: hypothetical protein VFB79_07385 [Candidatus Angelobacter sp.]|nr:hypothetical protein [Candidatus Angelobacter sp.]
MVISEAEAFDLVVNLIKTNINIFEKRGFTYDRHAIHVTKTGMNVLQFYFHNVSTGMKLRLHYTYPPPGMNAGFFLYIENPAGKDLDVEDYLRLHGFVKERLLFTYTDNVPDFQKYCETFLSTLDHLFSTELKPILDGKKWEDIPFDWGDYK